MQLTIITNFDVQYVVDILKNENGRIYFKRNINDTNWDYVLGSDVRYIKISDNISI